MSLLSSIQLASNALRAQQIGLQVVGQNIANANTPGYIRQEVVLRPAPTQQFGNILLGLGVEVEAVVQKIDLFLEDRVRGASSDLAASVAKEDAYLQLESIIGELTDTDLSTSLNAFFGSITEILNQPESASPRALAVLSGETLAGDFNRLVSRVKTQRAAVNDRIQGAALEINQLVEEVRTLNLRIVQTEGGGISKSDATGLRDQRGIALARLAGLIDVRIDEQPNGSINVFSGGTFLVFESTARSVQTVFEVDRGLNIASVQIAETQADVEITAGELAGLFVARDEILGGFIDSLDEFAATLAFEFNQVFSSGQGLVGYDDLTSEFSVDDVNVALDTQGLLDFTPVNGSFQVKIFNRETGLTQTSDIFVDLNGLDADMSLTDLAAALSAVNGLSASITPTGRLQLNSESPDQEFGFADDTSGVLAALGINTFFSGSTAETLGINSELLQDPRKFAASRSGIGGDTANAVELAAFLDRPLESASGSTLSQAYDTLISDVTQGTTVSKAVANGFRVFQQTLSDQSLSISGVSLDEEAVRLITFQRSLQATARYIATLNDLLQTLVEL